MSTGNPLVDRPLESTGVALVMNNTWQVPPEQRPKGWQTTMAGVREKSASTVAVSNSIDEEPDEWARVRYEIRQSLAAGKADRIIVRLPLGQRINDLQSMLVKWPETKAYKWSLKKAELGKVLLNAVPLATSKPQPVPVDHSDVSEAPTRNAQAWLEIRAAIVQMLANGRSKIELKLPPPCDSRDLQHELDTWDETRTFVWKTQAVQNSDTVTATVRWRRDDKRHQEAPETPTPAPQSDTTPTVEEIATPAEPPPLCACGRPNTHHGRCAARRAAHAAKMAAKNPSIPVEKCAVEESTVVVLPTQKDAEAFSRELLWPEHNPTPEPLKEQEEKPRLCYAGTPPVTTKPLSWIGTAPAEEALLALIATLIDDSAAPPATLGSHVAIADLWRKAHLHRKAKATADNYLNAWMSDCGIQDDPDNGFLRDQLSKLWQTVYTVAMELTK